MSVIGRVESVNVGRPRTVNWHGREVTSAIWKQPVAGRSRLRGVNVDGDDQADRRVHGGPTKAVYAYATDDYSGGARRWPPTSVRARSARTSPSAASTSPTASSASAGGSAVPCCGLPNRGSRASSSGCEWATPVSSTISPTPLGPARTSPSRARGRSAPAIRSSYSAAPITTSRSGPSNAPTTGIATYVPGSSTSRISRRLGGTGRRGRVTDRSSPVNQPTRPQSAELAADLERGRAILGPSSDGRLPPRERR